jgi:hypothetical protein
MRVPRRTLFAADCRISSGSERKAEDRSSLDRTEYDRRAQVPANRPRSRKRPVPKNANGKVRWRQSRPVESTHKIQIASLRRSDAYIASIALHRTPRRASEPVSSTSFLVLSTRTSVSQRAMKSRRRRTISPARRVWLLTWPGASLISASMNARQCRYSVSAARNWRSPSAAD